jgi:membrane fusion protein, copper/silver efflux system
VRTPLPNQDALNRRALEGWQRDTLVDLAVQPLLTPERFAPGTGLGPWLQAAGKLALLRQGLLLTLPESAVVDTGRQKVVYVETAPGMFDGVEVQLGPRCGAYFPVVGGLEFGQRVATTGAFLLDAEARLNPSLAAGYFGASRRPETEPAPVAGEDSAIEQALARLSPADRKRAEQQKTCPVTGGRLGSMGTPIRIQVGDKVIFVCCKACEPMIRKSPEKYVK